MRVIIGKSVYEMTAKQLNGVLKVASKQVSFGIYAVKKNGVCELKNENFKTKYQLIQAVKEYENMGFKVHYNS